MSYAQVALDRDTVYEPVSNETIAEKRTTRVIFFAGDAIPPHEKFEMEDIKGFGGIYLPHIRTLPQGDSHGSKGMVYQCKFTPLKTARKSEWKNMLPPDAREHWDTSFVGVRTEDGRAVKKTIHGFQGSNLLAAKKGKFETEISDHIVHKERYPGDDIRMATMRSVPNGVGGVVEVTDLLGATDEEIKEAQYYFFPNWDRLAAGLETLPNTIDAIEYHIKERIADIGNQLWDADRKRKYTGIGRDMVRSCTEFRRTGSQIIEKDDTALKAAAKDDAQVHSPISGHLLGQLKIQRKGDLLAGDHSAINRLAEVMEKKESGQGNDKYFLLEERKQYTAEIAAGLRERDDAEEIRLGIKKVAEPLVVHTVQEGTVSVAIPVAEGEEPTTEQIAEAAEKVKELRSELVKPEYAIGDKIPFDSGEAEVIGKPFGRVKVRLADGREVMLDKI